MATVKGLYDLIKKDEAEGKELNPFEQAIVDAYEAEDVSQTTKEVNATFIKKKNGGDNGPKTPKPHQPIIKWKKGEHNYNKFEAKTKSASK